MMKMKIQRFRSPLGFRPEQQSLGRRRNYEYFTPPSPAGFVRYPNHIAFCVVIWPEPDLLALFDAFYAKKHGVISLARNHIQLSHKIASVAAELKMSRFITQNTM